MEINIMQLCYYDSVTNSMTLHKIHVTHAVWTTYDTYRVRQ